jgi:vacuolar-type H+-ATPase subunit I/STV1
VSLIELYKLFLNKEKSLYSMLNRFKKEDKLFHGFCWIPRVEKILLDTKLAEVKETHGTKLEIPTFKIIKEHDCKPPSFFRINDFTWAF